MQMPSAPDLRPPPAAPGRRRVAPRDAALPPPDEALALLELRLTLEPEMAALAAERRERADLLRLARALEAVERGVEREAESGAEAVAAHAAFVAALAEATHNPAFAAFVGAYGTRAVALQHRADGPAPDAEAAARRRIRLRRVHHALAEALAAVSRQDGPAAREAWRRQLLAWREGHRAAAALGGLTVHAGR
jgi:DNA-binding FadR family transcriptional regulator